MCIELQRHSKQNKGLLNEVLQFESLQCVTCPSVSLSNTIASVRFYSFFTFYYNNQIFVTQPNNYSYKPVAAASIRMLSIYVAKQ